MTKEAQRILIVEDDKSLRTSLTHSLRAEGYHPIEAASVAFGRLQVQESRPDLILLDLGLPDADGMTLLRELRAAGDATPIIVLTARDDEASKVKALDLGADDYVSKPFGLAELFARVRSAFRHRVQVRGSAAVVQVGDVQVDLAQRRATKNAVEVHLSRKEFDLLAELVIRQGQPVAHADLLRAVWGDENADIRYLRVYIGQIRDKIETNPQNPVLITASPGFGYRFG